MKKIILSILFVGIAQAKAASFTCVETEESKKDYNVDSQIQLEILTPQKMKISLLPAGDTKAIEGNAFLNDQEDYADVDQDGNVIYELDDNYDRKLEARFVTSNADIAGSDADSILFIERPMLEGKAGKLSLSSGQANDGEGDAWLWGRAGEFNCTPQ